MYFWKLLEQEKNLQTTEVTATEFSKCLELKVKLPAWLGTTRGK